jgi:glycosyltransferase involved in cell wall biosynthesis
MTQEHTDKKELDFVVIGGPSWSETVNAFSLHMVRELSTQHRVLYLYSDTSHSALRALVRPAQPAERRLAVSTALGRLKAIEVQPRLWLAPLRGVTALLPRTYPEPFRQISASVLSGFLKSTCRRIGFDNPILWFYWYAHPEILERVPHVASVYDCIDEHGDYACNRRLAGLNAATYKHETRLMDAVDQTFVTSSLLLASKQSPQRRLALVPCGIDLAAVKRALGDSSRPQSLTALTHPIVGYVGDSSRVDWPLLRELAIRNDDWTFLFVGGATWPSGEDLPKNVQVYGPKPYHEILRYIREFDVGIVPFVLNDFTRACMPLKVLDYLAVGKSVIASQLPPLMTLEQDVPGLVTVPNEVSAWERALQSAIRHGDAGEDFPISPSQLSLHSTAHRAHKALAQVRECMAEQRNGSAAVESRHCV